MTLPAVFSMQDVNVELGRAAGNPWNMSSDISARQLANVNLTPGSPWSLSDLAGKTCYPMTLVVGKDSGTSQYGFNDGSNGGEVYGSLTPRLIAGQTIVQLIGDGLSMEIQGSHPKSFWRAVEFKANINNNPYTTLYSAEASFYQQAGGRTDWGGFASGNPGLSSRLGQTVYALFYR